jgi:hypothetical protein
VDDGVNRRQDVTGRSTTGTGAASARTKSGTRRKRKSPATAPRRGRLIGYGLLTIATAVVVACTLVYVRLLYGGISLAALTPSIERALAEDLGDKQVRIESAELRLADDKSLVLSLTQVALTDRDGQPLVQTPEARGTLSWSALKRGRLALSRIDIVAPRLNVTATPDGGYALSFARASASPTTRATSAQPPVLQPSAASEAGAFDVIKVLADASARARRRETASGYLRELGLSQAVLVVAHGQHRTVWNVPDVQIDLSHKRAQSSVSGKATIATLSGPLDVTVETQETEQSDHITLNVGVTGFNPRGLARLIPGLGMVETVDLPLAGKAKIVVSTDGRVKSAVAEAGANQGEARFGLLGRKPVPLETTRIALSYDGARGVTDISDFTFGWAGNRWSLAGQIAPDAQSGGQVFTLNSTSGVLAAPRGNASGAKVEQARASGRFAQGRFTLQDLSIRVAKAEVSAKGDVAWSNGTPTGQIDGKLSPMSVDVLKAIWPSVLAPGVRDWVAGHITKGQLAGGLFKAAIEGGPQRDGSTSETNARLSLTLEASNVEVQTVGGMPPIEIPRGLVRVEGQTIEITSPEFFMTAAEGRKLQFKTGRFTAVETAAGEQPTAEVAFRLNGPLAAIVDLADREPFALLKGNAISVAGLDGKLEGQIKSTFPLAENLQLTEVRSEGRLRITDLRARQVVGQHDISGGTVNVEIGDKLVDVKGDILVKGVAGKLGWQYVLNQPMAQQPPARIVVALDNADRTTLGLDVADLVQGETPVEVLVAFNEAGQPQPRVRIDLTKAELTFQPVAWQKAAGRPATFFFDPVRGPGVGAAQRLELQNMKLVGDDIALEGWMAIGPDNKPREFSFPEFTLNVVSRLAVHGKRRPDNVWEISAKGPTFDGREVFRALFSLGQTRAAARKDKPGLDITAEIDTVIGFSDTTAKSVKLKASERGEKLVDLDVKATLASGKPFAALIRNQPKTGRQLLAEGADAGQVFKLVGFYPSAVGGLMQLEVNLDGAGINEKNGTLWARDFAVLGDSIVGDLVQNAEPSPGSGQGPNQPKPQRQQRVRQQFDFDGLKIPFEVGAGQFVMNNAVIKGPIIGATFRGKIDFKQQSVNLGGTYVPLSGLNSALGGILGPLSGGPQGEGLFGLTFAVQGALANPQVTVNPLSLLGPGIFREIFQMTPETYKVTPRADTPPTATAPGTKSRTRTTPADPARASSAPAAEVRAPAAAAPPRPQGEVLPDWSSGVKTSPQRPAATPDASR